MPRFLLAVLAAVLLVLPATAEGQSTSRLRGTVALKSQANDLVTVRTKRQAVALRVPGSMSLIRIGQRIELRGSTLRAQGHRSRVLAHNVSIVSSQPLSTSSSPRAEDDEVEIKGKLTSLAPLTVTSATRSVTCSAPSAGLLAGFVVGDFVEITCDLVGGSWVLRELEHEDMADDDDDSSSGNASDDDDDHSGPGGDDDDDDDDDDSSGPGPGSDDDDD
ncbi:MAG: hypothetical protein OEW52_09725 [Thermoleophilia bacterium]|nr:hypothetical protein [Thermoleophilia bacterium]MDH4340454.1 hypothetical protein [Thermoleophilia bacterium]MDH5281410.1 hypothetical protein [Thermoleophilia bacterium]